MAEQEKTDDNARSIELDDTSTRVVDPPVRPVQSGADRAVLLDLGNEELNRVFREGARAAMGITNAGVTEPVKPIAVDVSAVQPRVQVPTVKGADEYAFIALDQLNDLNDLYVLAGSEGFEKSPIVQAVQRVLSDYCAKHENTSLGNTSLYEWMTSRFSKEHVLKFIRENTGRYGKIAHIFQRDFDRYSEKLKQVDGLEPAVLDTILPTDRCSMFALVAICDHVELFSSGTADSMSKEFYGKIEHLYSLVENGSPKSIFLQKLVADYAVRMLTERKERYGTRYSPNTFPYLVSCIYRGIQDIPIVFVGAVHGAISVFKDFINDITNQENLLSACFYAWRECFKDKDEHGLLADAVMAVLKQYIMSALEVEFVNIERDSFGVNRVQGYQSLRTMLLDEIRDCHNPNHQIPLSPSYFQEELDAIERKMTEAESTYQQARNGDISI